MVNNHTALLELRGFVYDEVIDHGVQDEFARELWLLKRRGIVTAQEEEETR